MDVRPVTLELESVSHRHRPNLEPTPPPTSFRLEPGERALLTAPNGAGKSTLLGRIAGLIHGPGRVRIDGREMIPRQARRLRRSIGLLLQSPEDLLLLPTPLEDVELSLTAECRDRAAIEAAAIAALADLGIGHLARRSIWRLSVGEKQLVALAGVLVRRPGLLLLDEPEAALDRAHADRLMAVLRDCPATQLIVSHHPERLEAGLGPMRRLRLGRNGTEATP